jgi:hypothetical protein
MYIANPIYDTVFKHLMENNRVARFFIETIIDQPVENIVVVPQEYTWFKSLSEFKTISVSDEFKMLELLSIIRYDFVATIRTPDGYKKILIEIQKAKNAVDLMRFRNYLGEQYKRLDKIVVDDKEIEEPLPIITIYLLGFKLAETDAIVIHVSRTYKDVISQKELHVKSEFIECLTHDSYVVQIPRIEGKTRTRLENMLNVFEQSNFYDEKGIIKQFRYDTNDENIRLMLEILYHIGANPEKREEIETEWRSYEMWLHEIVIREHEIIKRNHEIISMNKEIVSKNKEIISKNKEIISKNHEIVSKDHEIVLKDQEIVSKDQEIVLKNQEIVSKNHEIVSKDKELVSKDKELVSKDQELIEKKKMIEEQDKMIEELQMKLKNAGLN